jgi:hypothetical protein
MTLSANESREAWKAIASQAKFAGGQRIYTWRQLEPVEGEYDFSAIEADLAFLHNQKQHLILEVWDTTFQGNALPVPDYLLTNAIYQGGIARESVNLHGARTKRWVPSVMNRYLALMEALGRHFDRDPDFAGFFAV